MFSKQYVLSIIKYSNTYILRILCPLINSNKILTYKGNMLQYMNSVQFTTLINYDNGLRTHTINQ